MKKILLIIFLLTGCIKGTSLTTVCTKLEKTNQLNSTIIYQINYERDIINNVLVSKEYIGDKVTIDSVKLSFKTEHNFWVSKPSIEEVINTSTNYKVEYNISNLENDEINKYFQLQKERSKLVNYLKEDGFTCK